MVSLVLETIIDLDTIYFNIDKPTKSSSDSQNTTMFILILDSAKFSTKNALMKYVKRTKTWI